MDWFLYDNGLRHERVKKAILRKSLRRCYESNIIGKFNDFCGIRFTL